MFNWGGVEIGKPWDLEPNEAYFFLDDWEPLVQLVLDGTIQVWRPVEHYDVPCKEKVRRNPQKPVLFLHTDSTTTLETPWHWCEGLDGYIYSLPKRATHWMPLPEYVKEIKEC
jgi:hypothetical protein